jgi:uncharacterized membrane protein
MDMDGMGSMMGWMMGLGLLGWVLVIGLLVAILVVLVRILNRSGSGERAGSPPPREGQGEIKR